jgi:hypothetical protein
MTKQIKNEVGESSTRLQALQNSIDDLVIRARHYCERRHEDPATAFHFFCLGFGFGNMFGRALGRDVAGVRNLLAIGPDSDVVVDAKELLGNWRVYRKNLSELTRDMLGATPMVEAFSRAESIINSVYTPDRFRDKPIVLVVSDGLPTDPPKTGPDLVRHAAKRLRDKGVIVVSCYVTSHDAIEQKILYASPRADWNDAARLMFDCASPISTHPFFRSHLAEYEWEAEEGAKLFAQINQSEFLSEFMQLVVTPVEESADMEDTFALAHHSTDKEVRVFISYSHADSKYVDDSPRSLTSYLRGLEHEDIYFWWDRRINAGDLWDDEIKGQLESADIVLALVSRQFLNSEYIRNVEVAKFIQARKERGLRVVPVIISACDWQSHDWLATTQFLPLDGKNIEEHFGAPGKRKSLYRKILAELRSNAAKIRQWRTKSGKKC